VLNGEIAAVIVVLDIDDDEGTARRFGFDFRHGVLPFRLALTNRA
jgi:hypothetical protein